MSRARTNALPTCTCPRRRVLSFFIFCRLCEISTFQQSREPRILAQGVVHWIGFQKDSKVFLVDCPMKPFEGVISVSQANVDFCNHQRWKRSWFELREEPTQNLTCFIAISRPRIGVSQRGIHPSEPAGMFLRNCQLGDPSHIASILNAGYAEAGMRRGMRWI